MNRCSQLMNCGALFFGSKFVAPIKNKFYEPKLERVSKEQAEVLLTAEDP